MMLLLFLRLIVLLYVSTFARATDEEGKAFLAENREKEGVVELASGLQYKILTHGTGIYHPEKLCRCQCHYEGKLINGHVFDSSYERGEPLSVAPSQVIAGWTEAMTMMVQGDKWELYIPSELGYGDRGHPPDIPGHAVLIFTMEMVAVDCDQKRVALKCSAETGESCNERELGYIEKIKGWTADKVTTEMARLDKILGEGTPLKEALKEWVQRRQHLLKQLAPSDQEL